MIDRPNQAWSAGFDLFADGSRVHVLDGNSGCQRFAEVFDVAVVEHNDVRFYVEALEEAIAKYDEPS